MANRGFDDKATAIRKTPVSSLTVRRTRSATARVHEMVIEYVNDRDTTLVLNLSEARQLRDWINVNILKTK